MEKKQVIEFMDRIKSHYQEFIIDDFKIKEWYDELKDYLYEDVSAKLDEHLRSEQYGNYIPKVYFLTKYLTKEKDKGIKNECTIACSICGKHILNTEMEEHYDRCISIQYLIKNSEKYFNKKLNREKLEQADDETFKKYYWKFCKELLPKVNDNPVFRKSLENKLEIYNGRVAKYTMEEILH